MQGEACPDLPSAAGVHQHALAVEACPERSRRDVLRALIAFTALDAAAQDEYSDCKTKS